MVKVLAPTVTVSVFEYSGPLLGAMTLRSVGIGAAEIMNVAVEFFATVPELALSVKVVPLMAFPGIDAVQLASWLVTFLIVTVLLPPAGALAPHGMAVNTIEAGVTVIG
jgi:hypothetical protein